jgi:hypothetical protein
MQLGFERLECGTFIWPQAISGNGDLDVGQL